MRHDADGNRRQDDTVAVPIADSMDEGLPVFDEEKVKIGAVRRYDLEAGYIEVETRGLARKELYLPFHLMQSITPREIVLRVSKSTLTDTDAYLLPPAARSVVEQQIDPDTGRSDAVIVHELRSGSDGQMVQTAPVPVDVLTHAMTVGMTVMDANDEYVGEVMQIDTERSLLTVRNSVEGTADRTISFDVVVGVDPDLGVVTLLVPSVALDAEGRG